MIKNKAAGQLKTSIEPSKLLNRLRVYAGGILVVTGSLTLMQLLTGYDVWGKGWPLILISVGLIVILGRQK
ncbi:MAG TPA: hypothetical protein VJM32_01240 [Candidatus Saccharimonadales bacterium]|nr:hypothetical protein [Candidatus Saccharimonadales bacterium]